MRVLQVSAEIFPLLKTGGLADVAGALPQALIRAGADARPLLPGFPALLAGLADAAEVATVALPWGGTPARLLHGRLPALGDLPAYVVHHAGLYERPGNPYHDERLVPYADNHRRFALLGLAAARMAEGADGLWRPQVVHGHDWHAGLAAAYVAAARRAGYTQASTVQTIHNIAYAGNFDASVFGQLGLPGDFLSVDGVEFYGQVSFLKAGLYHADRITTVSPTYAREIQGPEQGGGLDGLLRTRAAQLEGILNGVDPAVWSPERDPLIPRPFGVGKLAGKRASKAALQRELGLAEAPQTPLFCVVSRLAEQKGLPLVLSGLPELLARGGQLAVLGSGERWLEEGFLQQAAARPDAVAVRIGYDEALAHRLFAGSDVTLVPSRFEPCGLTQLYGLAYGCLPLVRRVGGLADTVVDCTLEDLADGTATGFVFDGYDDASYSRALRRAFALYARPRAWGAVQRHAMMQRFDWDAAAARYLLLYRGLTGET